jgi:hypothetical protein
LRLGAFANVGAEDGVNEPSLRTEAQMFGEFDCFVNGGVFGNAIEEKNLVKPKLQQKCAAPTSAGDPAFCDR